MQNQLVAFSVLAGLLTMLPGIDTAQVLRSATLHGPKNAYATLMGILLGVWVWGIAAAIGVSALLLTSATIYRGFLLLSAGYLLYLGIRMLIESRHVVTFDVNANRAPTSVGWKAFFRASLITISNPKTGAFYVAVLPQFMPDNMSALAGGLLLSTIHNVLTFAWFSAMIWGTNLAREFFMRARVRMWMERISGAALIGFGVRMALEAKH